MSAVTEALPGFDLLPRVEAPVWGIDPSSKRIALGALTEGPELHWDTIALSQVTCRAQRFGEGLARQVAFFSERVEAWGRPAAVYLEEPYVPRDRRQEPTHLFMYGVTLAALGKVLGSVDVREIQPSSWKAKALGAGRGHAEKPEILAWAQGLGYDGAVQDVADAIGVCVAGAVLRSL